MEKFAQWEWIIRKGEGDPRLDFDHAAQGVEVVLKGVFCASGMG